MVKPAAQRVPSAPAATTMMFDIVGTKSASRQARNGEQRSLSLAHHHHRRRQHLQQVNVGRCTELCLFPFVRIHEPPPSVIATAQSGARTAPGSAELMTRNELFRARETCQSM